MDCLVEFEAAVPDGTPESEIKNRERAGAAAAAKLVDEAHLVLLWQRHVGPRETRILGLYRADTGTEPDELLAALPLLDQEFYALLRDGRGSRTRSHAAARASSEYASSSSGRGQP